MAAEELQPYVSLVAPAQITLVRLFINHALRSNRNLIRNRCEKLGNVNLPRLLSAVWFPLCQVQLFGGIAS